MTLNIPCFSRISVMLLIVVALTCFSAINVSAECSGILNASEYGDNCIIILRPSRFQEQNWEYGCSTATDCLSDDDFETRRESGPGTFTTFMDFTNVTYGTLNIYSVNITSTLGGNSGRGGTFIHKLKFGGTTYTNFTENFITIAGGVAPDDNVSVLYITNPATGNHFTGEDVNSIYVGGVASSTDDNYAIGEMYIHVIFEKTSAEILDGLLLNASGNKETLSLSNINEVSLFYLAANYTNSGAAISSGVCNATALNVSAFFSKDSLSNYTMNSSSDKISILVIEGNTSLINDHIEFEACREQGVPDLIIRKDGSIFRTIRGEEIPLCSVGFTDFINETKEFKNDSNINITLECSGCIPASKRIRIVPNNGVLLRFERDFSTHTEPLYYNSTTSLYEYTNYPYHYTYSGVNRGSFSVNCNGTTDSDLFNVGDTNVTVNIVSINDVPFNNSMNIESTAITNILISTTGDVVESISFNITYNNGTFIKESNSRLLTLSNTELNVDGIYNLTINVIDDDGTPTNVYGWFSINDTTVPVINFIYPLESNTSTMFIGNNVTINITFSDLNLYAYNFSMLYENGSVFRNEFLSGMSSLDYNISFTTFLNISGTYVLNLEVADNHHLSGKNKVKDWDVKMKSDTLEYNDCVEIEFEGAYDVGTVKYDYFYDFSASWAKSEPYRHVKIKSCMPIEHIKDSPYNAHFVILGAGMWIDFEGVKEKPIVEYMGNNTYELTFYTLGDKVTFESIGGLNIVSKSVTLQVIEPSYMSTYDVLANATPESWTKRIDVSTTPGILMLFLYLCICTALTGIGVVFGSGEIVAFSGIVWLFFGFIIAMNTSVVFGFILAIFGVLLILIGGMSLRN